MCGLCSLIPAFQSLGTLPANPDSGAPNPEHQPGGHASLWVGQQVLYVPGAGAALAPRQAVCTPGGKLSSKQEWQAEREGQQEGGAGALP